jgi:hypothetical protein
MKKITILSLLISSIVFSQCPNPTITSWSMTGTTAEFGGTNDPSIISYEIQYNEGLSFTPSTPAPAGVQTFTFTSFPASLTGLSVATDYYFTIRTICASDTGSWYDNGSNGPDLWTTSADCPNSLPYFNDFEQTSCWPFGPQWHTNNGSPGNYWAYYNDFTTMNTYAKSESWTQNQGALNPDCWVVFGPIDMGGVTDAKLSFKVRGSDPAWCQENYTVYFGNSENITVLENSPYTFTETIASGSDACGDSWADREINISGLSSSTGYIALRHHGVSDMFQIHFDDLSLNSTVSTTEIENIEMDIYPNPTNNVLNIKSDLKYIGSNYSVFDNRGKVVLTGIINSNITTLNTEILSEGIYLLSAGDNIKRKFIVMR